MRSLILLLANLILLFFLVGCGQKGPLYLPPSEIDSIQKTNESQ